MPRVSLIIKMDLKEQANFLPKQRFASIVSLKPALHMQRYPPRILIHLPFRHKPGIISQISVERQNNKDHIYASFIVQNLYTKPANLNSAISNFLLFWTQNPISLV